MANKKIDSTIKMCEIGDTLYRICKDRIIETTVTNIRQNMFDTCIYDCDGRRSNYFFNKNIGSTYFKTKEEAEKKLQEKSKIIEKRRLLKEYERELNKKLDLKDHYIFK